MASKDKVFWTPTWHWIIGQTASRSPNTHTGCSAGRGRQLTLCVSSLSFSNLYYILRKLKGHPDALALLRKLKLLVRVSAVTDAESSPPSVRASTTQTGFRAGLTGQAI